MYTALVSQHLPTKNQCEVPVLTAWWTQVNYLNLLQLDIWPLQPLQENVGFCGEILQDVWPTRAECPGRLLSVGQVVHRGCCGTAPPTLPASLFSVTTNEDLDTKPFPSPPRRWLTDGHKFCIFKFKFVSQNKSFYSHVSHFLWRMQKARGFKYLTVWTLFHVLSMTLHENSMTMPQPKDTIFSFFWAITLWYLNT